MGKNIYLSYFRIARPLNCIFVILTTFLGFYYLQHHFQFSIIFACLSASFIAASGYIINDYFDYPIDLINKPQRPISQGTISLLKAKRYGSIIGGLGILFAILTFNTLCLLLVLLNSISLFFYAFRGKKTFLLGNIIVAWNSSSTFLLGALLNNNYRNIISLIIISFMYTIIREWVKQIEDYEGDLAGGVHSIIVTLGRDKAKNVISIPIFMMIIVLCLFWRFKIISFSLFWSLFLIIIIPLIILYYFLIQSKHQKTIYKIHIFMKLNMFSIVILYIIHDLLVSGI